MAKKAKKVHTWSYVIYFKQVLGLSD